MNATLRLIATAEHYGFRVVTLESRESSMSGRPRFRLVMEYRGATPSGNPTKATVQLFIGSGRVSGTLYWGEFEWPIRNWPQAHVEVRRNGRSNAA